jgi:chromosomal replication initiator protein
MMENNGQSTKDPGLMPRRPILRIILEVAAEAGVTSAELRGRSRKASYAGPRHLAMYRAKHEAKASLRKIARVFGRDHTSVLHGIRAAEERQRRE